MTILFQIISSYKYLLYFPPIFSIQNYIFVRLVSGSWSALLNLWSDMFLPTHTPVFSLSFSFSAAATAQSTSKARASDLSSSSHGLMKHSAGSYKEQRLTLLQSYFFLCFAILLLVVYLTACRCSLVFC
jgi:hypothetical protein